MKELSRDRSSVSLTLLESLFGTVNSRDCHRRRVALSITRLRRSSLRKLSSAAEVRWRRRFSLGGRFFQDQLRPFLM